MVLFLILGLSIVFRSYYADTYKMPEMNSVPHFYIFDKKGNPESKLYDFGQMSIEGKKLMKTTMLTDSIHFIDKIRQATDSLDGIKNGLVVYIHGYQGDNKYFMQQSGYILQKDIFESQDHTYGMVLSLQWTSVIPYENAVKNAYSKGVNFVPYLEEMYNLLKSRFPSAKVTFFCHSMGNRVFQGIYEEWIKINPELKLDNVIMMSADLESNIFDTAFPNFSRHVKKVHIYHHLGDKTLQLANAMKSHSRLGINGLDKETTNISNVVIRDATNIIDDESFAGKLTNHRYYYGSPAIRQEIVEILKH